METIRNILDYYNDHPDDWSYYHNVNMDIKYVLDNSDEALRFIKEYFCLGGKSEAFLNIDNRQLGRIPSKRFIHIVSTFFLGLKVAECCGISTAERNSRNMSFQYYWFLSCLFHDIGYIYENEAATNHIQAVARDGLEEIRTVCNVSRTPYSIFMTYPREIVELYLKHRATGTGGKIDHGISGGLVLYDRLRKQFEREYRHRCDPAETRYSFHVEKNGRLLHYSRSHFDDYAKAADAIVAHNIWQQKLREYLIDENNMVLLRLANSLPKKISVANELCFILCVTDSIEPLKRNPVYIDQVNFSFENNEITIYPTADVYHNVYSDIKDLGAWLDINVVSTTDKIVISIIR